MSRAGQKPGSRAPVRPDVGVGFLVSLALVGAAVAVIVPTAVGYAARHGEGRGIDPNKVAN